MRFMWLWLFIALLIAGCASRYTARPEIALVDLSLGEITLLETGLNAVVRIDNEGQYPLRINGGVFRLFLNDIDVGRGMTSAGVTVPRLGSANQEVLFRLNNISLISRIQSLLESNQFSYKISGNVYVSGGLGFERGVPVEHTGRLDLTGY
jgi:LEA14-like dessication related protein